MRRDLEALLFATDQPLSMAKLVSLIPRGDRKKIRAAIDELREEYDKGEHAFTIVEFGGGFSIATRPEYASVVKKLFKGRRKLRLSQASLEVLSIVAYKQPVTRIEIEEIRGVSASGVLGTLLERELIAIVGRAEGLGNPLLYGTTKSFLDYLGLREVKELPQLTELEDLLAEREQLKQLAAQWGEEVSDEEFEAAAEPPQDEPVHVDAEPEDVHENIPPEDVHEDMPPEDDDAEPSLDEAGPEDEDSSDMKAASGQSGAD